MIMCVCVGRSIAKNLNFSNVNSEFYMNRGIEIRNARACLASELKEKENENKTIFCQSVAKLTLL